VQSGGRKVYTKQKKAGGSRGGHLNDFFANGKPTPKHLAEKSLIGTIDGGGWGNDGIQSLKRPERIC